MTQEIQKVTTAMPLSQIALMDEVFCVLNLGFHPRLSNWLAKAP